MSCRSSSAAGLHFTLIQEFRSAIFAPSALSLKKRRATPIKVNCFLVNWWKRMKKERLKLSLLGQKHITAKRMPQCKRFIFWWRQQQTIHFNLISSFKQRKVNFLFIEFSNDWRELMNEIKRYYNSNCWRPSIINQKSNFGFWCWLRSRATPRKPRKAN